MEVNNTIYEPVNIKCNNIKTLNQSLKSLSRDKLIITSINARSCANLQAFDEIKFYLNECTKKSDIVIIGETWFNNKQLNLYEIRGYTAIHSCREGRRGGGLSMYVHERWIIKKSEVNKIRNCDSIRITITSRSQSDETIEVVGVYRPPSQSQHQVSDFLLSLEEVLDELTTKKCIVAGDFNIDVDKNDTIVQSNRLLWFQYLLFIPNKACIGDSNRPYAYQL